jgi:ABC-type transport system involved in cytochrome bd biosynthesis fused ATPase/permease subunit
VSTFQAVQKQRLALAPRNLAAKSSDIILLDEPTSSVDSKTENQIYEKLFEEYSNKVIVSSLHRLYMLAHFDYIYVLSTAVLSTKEHLRTYIQEASSSGVVAPSAGKKKCGRILNTNAVMTSSLGSARSRCSQR